MKQTSPRLLRPPSKPKSARKTTSDIITGYKEGVQEISEINISITP